MSTSRKGKRIAVVTVAVGLVVLGVAGYVFRDSLVEQYWFYRLEHGDVEARKTAAEKLSGMMSVRAIPVLIENITDVFASVKADPIGGLMVWDSDPSSEPREVLNHISALQSNTRALALIGLPSVPALLDAVRSSNSVPSTFRACCPEILAIIGDVATPVLQAARDDPDDAVKSCAADALDRIQAGTHALPR